MRYRISVLLLLAPVLLAGCATTAVDGEKKNAEAAARANTQLGVEYLRKGDYETSLKKLKKALEINPNYADAHDVIAVLYERVGELDLAEKHYKRGLKLSPDNAGAHNNYGRFLCNSKRYKEAEEEFQVAAGNAFYASPELPLFNAGLCMEGQPDPDKAESYYRQALEKNPGFAPALLQMASINFARENFLSARGYLQRFQQASPHTPESLWLGVRTEYALQDHKAWGKYALQLKNNFPDSRQTAQLMEWEHEHRSGQ
ncbi:MAG: type IV pilus biogenesis/stability protein PilW [Pseudomonadota bacterium]